MGILSFNCVHMFHYRSPEAVARRCSVRTFSSCLLSAIIARNDLPISNYFQIFNIFANFWNILPFLTFSALFLPFFWKIVRMPLLSTTDPVCKNVFLKTSIHPAALIKRFWLRCFTVHFAKFLRKLFLEHLLTSASVANIKYSI